MKHVVVGVAALVLGAWGLYVWFDTFGTVMRGLVPILLVVFGLVALLAGYKRVAKPARGETVRRRAEREILEDEDDEDEDEDEDRERGAERKARRGTDEEEVLRERKARRAKDEEPEEDDLDDEEPEEDDLDDEEPEGEVTAAKR